MIATEEQKARLFKEFAERNEELIDGKWKGVGISSATLGGV